ncbi:MAG: class I SAM-dependent methyltransferase [Parachlamydiaceae bacterium]|nr:class I SAM-dependent methyltransferase [Parachlamydiaceae bacterium]
MKINKMPSAEMNEIMPLLIGVWRRYMKISGPSDHLQTREFRDVVTAVQQLQKGLESGRELVGQDYFSKPELLSAYILYYWTLHYQQGLSLINEIPNGPGRVLDLASGPGAFSFAALKHGAREVIALDKNQTALKLAGEICGRHGYPLSARRHDILRFPYPVEGKFDLIIVGHCLEELFPDTEKEWNKKQRDWVKKLYHYLSPKGMILFVESSVLHVNHRVLALRDQLVKEDYPVQAPCVWRGECPALLTKNPCYAQRDFEKPHLIKNIQRACAINLSSLKMSYLLMRNPESGQIDLPNHPVYRVISPPIDTHAGKRFYLCGTDGRKDLGSNLKEQPIESRAFEYLKRGELISLENPVVRGDHFDIVLGTRIKIEAALNKPVVFDDADA